MKTNRFTPFLLTLLAGSLLITACDDTSENNEPKGAYEHGVFITNEGNYGTPNSEISYLSKDGKTVTPELFQEVNDRPLGDGAQSTTFIGDRAYIAVNNSKKIEVVDAYTFQSKGVINGLEIPRYMAAASNNKAYVTEYVGYGPSDMGRVSVLDLTTNTVTKTIEVGLLPEGLLMYNNKLYVANSGDNTLSVINTTTDVVEATINVGESPKHLVLDAWNKIWVLRGGFASPGALVRIDPASNNSLTSYAFPAGTSGPGQLVTNGAKNILYYTYSGSVYALPLSQNMPAINTFPVLINRDAYGLGVDPETGMVYLGIGGYTSNGKVVRFQPTGQAVDSFQVRVLPNGFTFR